MPIGTRVNISGRLTRVLHAPLQRLGFGHVIHPHLDQHGQGVDGLDHGTAETCAPHEERSVAKRPRNHYVVACLEAPAGTQIRVQPDVGKPQQGGRVEGDRPFRVTLARPVGGHLVRPKLAVLIKTEAPRTERLVDILDVFHLQAPLHSKRGHGGEGRLLQQENVLDHGVDENVVSQCREGRRRRLRRPAVQQPRERLLKRDFDVGVGLPGFLPLPGALGLPEPRRVRQV